MKTTIFFFLLLGHQAFSQTPNTLLWEISGKGLKSPSFVFGTYHLITSTYIDSFPVIRQKLEKTEAVAGEMVIDVGVSSKIASAVVMKDSSLTQLLSKEDYQLVGTYLKEITGMDLSLFDKMKPVVISTFLYSPMLKEDQGKAMDIYFQDLAKGSGKKVMGLETVEEQIALLFEGS